MGQAGLVGMLGPLQHPASHWQSPLLTTSLPLSPLLTTSLQVPDQASGLACLRLHVRDVHIGKIMGMGGATVVR